MSNELQLFEQAQNALIQNQVVITALQDEIQALKKHNMELVDQTETWRRISNSDNCIEMSAVAKAINREKIGRNKLFSILREMRILRFNNEPYQEFVDAKYFRLIEQEVNLGNGETMINRKTLVLQKGIDFIRRKLDEYFDTKN